MTDGRALFIVRFRQTDDGGCGDVIDCTQVNEIGGLASYPLREGVATGGPANPGVNVALFAASDREAIAEARTRGDAYGRAHGHAHRGGA
jgi:hypothetical protein